MKNSIVHLLLIEKLNSKNVYEYYSSYVFANPDDAHVVIDNYENKGLNYRTKLISRVVK